MKAHYKGLRTAISAIVAVAMTACSGVTFSPGPIEEPFRIPDTMQKESFNIDDENLLGKVDILFVIDNSWSMLEEQEKLGAALSSFINGLKQLDWQIGVTTTDVSHGPFGLKGSLMKLKGTNAKVLTKVVPNYQKSFLDSVVFKELKTCHEYDRQNPCPSGDERPLEAIKMAMQKRYAENAGFFREGANLAVVVLSDEDENSTGQNAMSAAEVVVSFSKIFGSSKSLSGYGIVIEPGDAGCFNTNMPSGNYGHHVSELARLTGGLTGSICDFDYGTTLSKISGRVQQSIRNITLRHAPNPASIVVELLPADPSVTWTLQGNTIRFSKAPAKGTKVDVTYMPLQPESEEVK